MCVCVKGPLEEGMATHSSIILWRTLWTEKPGGLQSIGSQRVGQDRINLAQHMYAVTHRTYRTLVVISLIFPLESKEPSLYKRLSSA